MTDVDWDEYRRVRGTTAFPADILREHACGRVLDVGCGAGEHLARLAGAALRTGIERADAGLRTAKRKHPAIAFVRADAVRLPFRDGALDTVLAIDVVEHIPAAERMLAEAARVLRTGGKLLLQTPNYPVKRAYDVLNWVRGRRKSPADDPTHVRRFDESRLRRALGGHFDVLALSPRNLLLEGRIPGVRRLKSTRAGRLLGQKIVVVATPARDGTRDP